MTHLYAIILGLVEGITEFVPVSSTFHLLQAAHFLGIPQTEFMKMFEVVIQAGAVSAVFFAFPRRTWFNRHFTLKLLISTLPALIVGFLLRDFIKDVLFSAQISSIVVFIIIGVLFLLVEWRVSRQHDNQRLRRGIPDITYRLAVLIGLVQVLALMPGVSRSGIIIIGMLLMRFKREEAAAYSFALAVPVIFAASTYDLFKYVKAFGVGEMRTYGDMLALGFVVAGITGYFIARWLVRYLQQSTLALFGIYRIVAGIILLVVAHVV